MRRMIVRELIGPEGLSLVEEPDAKPSPDEVAIDVRVAGCNFADTLICRGKYQIRPELPFAPGAEVAGVVSEVGRSVTRFRPGDHVLALLPFGGYASRIVAPETRVFAVPSAVPFEEAVALGTVYQTAWFALQHRAPLRPSETLLVHAAAGGVGLAALQIGVAKGARVIGTAGSDEKLALIRAHGAEEALDYRDRKWIESVRELTGGRGADVIFDPVGGDAFEGSMKCIAWEGRLHVIGFASGTIPNLAMNRVMLKNVSIVGLHLGPYFDHDPALVRTCFDDLLAMVERAQIKPVVSASFPLEQAKEALEALGSRRTIGKIVLIP